MKALSTLLLFVLLVVSCGKKESPVQEYVDYLHKATQVVEAVQNEQEYTELDGALDKIRSTDIFKKYADYELTDADKEEIKLASSEFLHAVLNKTIEFGGLDEAQKGIALQQVPQVIKASDMIIDQAKTFGDLDSLK